MDRLFFPFVESFVLSLVPAFCFPCSSFRYHITVTLAPHSTHFAARRAPDPYGGATDRGTARPAGCAVAAPLSLFCHTSCAS